MGIGKGNQRIAMQGYQDESVTVGSCPNAEIAFPLNENAPHLEGNQGKGLKSFKQAANLLKQMRLTMNLVNESDSVNGNCDNSLQNCDNCYNGFLSEMEKHGYPVQEIIPDGKIQRFKLNGDTKKAGWYVFFADGVCAGAFGDWKTGNNIRWSSKAESEMSPDEIAEYRRNADELRRIREEAVRAEQEKAQKKADWIWNNSEPADNHAYLQKKGVKSYGLRQDAYGNLLIPVFTDDNVSLHGEDKNISTLQYINCNGEKRFSKGGRKKGGYFRIKGNNTRYFCFCEGYATGASLHEATDSTVIVCFDAGNLHEVIRKFRKADIHASLYVCGDDDVFTDGNPGREKAMSAAVRTRSYLTFPVFADNSEEKKLTDFNDLHITEGLESVIKCLESAKIPDAPVFKNPYFIKDGCTCYNKMVNDDPVTEVVSRFSAEITHELTLDNGLETQKAFRISGKSNTGKLFKEITIPANQFNGMNWVMEWGAGAVISSGQGKKDRLREAIQLLSENISEHTIYKHFGWRKIEDEWFYLTNSGAIGSDGLHNDVEVQSDNKSFERFTLPDPDGDLKAAVKASLRILDISDTGISVPALACIYRAPLNEFAEIDYSLFIQGQSGAQKTELSALIQAHFGKFSSRNLPEGWNSTVNALEKAAFTAKDSVMVIDDFAPNGMQTEVAKLHAKAETLFRNAANRNGRGRMNADGSMRNAYTPRCLIVSTGEDTPGGQSLKARLLIIELERGSIRLDVLTDCQKAAENGLFALSMSGYVRWLSSQDLDNMGKKLSARKTELRNKALVSVHNSHARTPDNIASVFIGFEIFLDYALSVSAISRKDAEKMKESGWEALLKTGNKQADLNREDDPVNRFFEILNSAISGGQAHIARTDNGKPDNADAMGWRGDVPQGVRVGWADEDGIYLDRGTAFTAVQQIAKAQNSNIAVGQKTLWKMMKSNGFLERVGRKDITTVKKTISGKRIDVLHIKRDLLEKTDTTYTTDTDNIFESDNSDSCICIGSENRKNETDTTDTQIFLPDENEKQAVSVDHTDLYRSKNTTYTQKNEQNPIAVLAVSAVSVSEYRGATCTEVKKVCSMCENCDPVYSDYCKWNKGGLLISWKKCQGQNFRQNSESVQN